MNELPSLLGALPKRGPVLLVGDLNALSPLDFVAANYPASASQTAALGARANATSTLEQLRKSRKFKKKFLTSSGEPGLRVMSTFLAEGLRDLVHLSQARFGQMDAIIPGATWRAGRERRMPTPEEEELARVQPSPPPPPPGASSKSIVGGASPDDGPGLRIDYALGNSALVHACRSPDPDRPWGVWAEAVPPEVLDAHGLRGASEHSPLQVVLGEGRPPGQTLAEATAAFQAQETGARAAKVLAASVHADGATAGGKSTAAVDGASPSAAKVAKPRPSGALPKTSKEPSVPARSGSSGGGGGGGGGSRASTADLEQLIETMPGGEPAKSASGGASGGSCDALGAGKAKNLARLKSELAEGEGYFTRRCQALSGVLGLLGLKRRLKTCAVVGGSGILKQHPRGGEIDQHEAILRVNNCPVGGFEDLVGSRTSVRFLNGPRSIIWGREIAKQNKKHPKAPPELLNNDHVVVWGDSSTLGRLKSAMPPNASAVRANTRFRRECADKTFWSADELDKHRAENKVGRLEITFGFEAVAHALYACERVDIYGFFLDPTDATRQTNAASAAPGKGRGEAMRTPYHYYENATYDKSAKDPWRPWTYKFHNFELEHRKFRQLEAACYLRIITT